jgi:hypothetical protein
MMQAMTEMEAHRRHRQAIGARRLHPDRHANHQAMVATMTATVTMDLQETRVLIQVIREAAVVAGLALVLPVVSQHQAVPVGAAEVLVAVVAVVAVVAATVLAARTGIHRKAQVATACRSRQWLQVEGLSTTLFGASTSLST